MLTDRQQVVGTGSAWNLSVLLGIVGVCAVLSACEGPLPRSKPWREPLAQSGDVDTESALGGEERAQLGKRQRERARSLRIHMNADPGSLNPLANPSVWSLRITRDNVFESLLRYQSSPGAGPGRYQGVLARSWTVSPGGREIAVLLRDNAKFQDGKPVTALDVQFSLEAAMTRRGGARHHQRALADVAGVDIVGRTRVRIRLSRPNAFVLRELAAVPILPEHHYRRRLSQRSGAWIGSGPYEIVSIDEEGVELERDDSYWGKAPAIERVHFVRQQDAAVALREAREGHIDIVPELIAEHYPQQLEVPGVAQSFSVLELRPSIFPYIALDATEPPFDDANVRRAIAHLVDRGALIDASGGLSRSVAAPIWPGGPGDGASPAPPAYDRAEAARLLELAGWRDDDGDNVRVRAGQRLMITVLATEGTHAVRDSVLASLRKAGFVLDIRVGNAAVLRNRLRDAQFDLAFVTWAGDFDRDLSPLLASGGWLNHGGFSSQVVDALLGKIRTAWEPANRAPLLGSLADALRRSMPVVALPVPHPRGLVHERVRGLEVHNGWFFVRDLRLVVEAS